MGGRGRTSWCTSPITGRRPIHPALAPYQAGGAATGGGPGDAPFVSINYGAAGIAYGIYRLGRSRGERPLLQLASAWVEKAFALSSDAKAYFVPEMGITPETVGQVSLFYSASGLHCVDALVRMALGEPAGAARAIEAFVQRSRGPCDNPDLTVGASSLLLGCAELVESAGTCWLPELSLVRARGDEIAADLSKILDSERIATSTRIPFLGMAHGWAGLLFALLRWTRATQLTVQPVLAAKLEELANLAIRHDGGLCWTMHNNSSALMPGWCHGTAGYTMLFALSHEVQRTPRHADLAAHAAASAWSIPTSHGSLCCGNGGNGYAFLAAYRLTGDRLWLGRARVAARRALRETSTLSMRDSLYKGRLGVGLLASELDCPATASMPLFEPVRFNGKVSQ